MVRLSMEASKSGFVKISGGEAPNMVADWAKGTLADGTVPGGKAELPTEAYTGRGRKCHPVN